jgi:hypothetical protein
VALGAATEDVPKLVHYGGTFRRRGDARVVRSSRDPSFLNVDLSLHHIRALRISTQAAACLACRISSTSTEIVTSLLTRTPPVSSAWFQVSPKSVRSIFP